MDIEEKGDQMVKGDDNGGDGGKWKIVQWGRRPRKGVAVSKEVQGGSQFVVLNGKPEDVDQPLGEKDMQKEISHEARTGWGQHEVSPKLQRKPEKAGSRGSSKKGVERAGSSGMERSSQEGRKEWVVKVKKGKLGPKVGCRGAASKGFAAVVKDMKFRYNLDLVVILEPQVSGSQASRIIKNWGFKHYVRLEAEEFFGGIWLVWSRDDLTVNVIVQKEQFIHCRLYLNGVEMLFSAV
ncbi:hypothetical protein K1719_007220 [Acacia pycnantha]|nr:hypothetical protein K1719_007220 [Acacia pycnantha]